MPIIPWKPFGELDKFFEEGLSEFDWTNDKRIPRMDVYEDNKNVTAEIELPGVNSKDIDVEVKDGVLSVEAKKKEKSEKKEKGYYRREITSGYYKRTANLPAEVQEEKADANYKDGVLKVVIPKVKPSKPGREKSTKIKVKGE